MRKRAVGQSLLSSCPFPLVPSLEAIANVFSRVDFPQQSIESPGCIFQRLLVGVGNGLQHLVETTHGSLELLLFFARDSLLRPLPDRPNQVRDSFPEIAISALAVFVLHGLAG